MCWFHPKRKSIWKPVYPGAIPVREALRWYECLEKLVGSRQTEDKKDGSDLDWVILRLGQSVVVVVACSLINGCY